MTTPTENDDLLQSLGATIGAAPSAAWNQQMDMLKRLNTLVQRLAGSRYTQSGNTLYLQAAGLQTDLNRALLGGGRQREQELSELMVLLTPLEQRLESFLAMEHKTGLPSLGNRLSMMAETLLEARGDLAGYSAHRAADRLVTHWKDALADGRRLPDLVVDVDQVIETLQEFKRAALALDDLSPGLGDERLAAANQQYQQQPLPGEVLWADQAWLAPEGDEWHRHFRIDVSGEWQSLVMKVMFAPGSAEVLSTCVVDRTTGAPVEYLAQAPAADMESVDLEALRERAAAEALETYDFGGAIITDRGGWDRNDPDDWVVTLYVEPNEPVVDDERDRFSFHVRFEPGSDAVADAIALDARTGSEVGHAASALDLSIDTGLVDLSTLPPATTVPDVRASDDVQHAEPAPALLDLPDLVEESAPVSQEGELPPAELPSDFDDLLPPA